MHVHPGNRLLVTLSLSLAAVFAVGIGAPRTAHAQVSDAATCPANPPACTPTTMSCCTRDFTGTASQKAIVIPMDRCHQPPAAPGAVVASTTTSPTWCSNPVGNGVGMNHAYGLVFRLMQYGIPVYWIANPTKAPSKNANYSGGDVWTEKDVDFWI